MPFIAINPTSEEVVAEFPAHSSADVDQALKVASAAFQSWKSTSFDERAQLMTRAAELLESEVPVVAALMTSEMGKTFAAAKGEAMKCVLAMRYFAEHTN